MQTCMLIPSFRCSPVMACEKYELSCMTKPARYCGIGNRGRNRGSGTYLLQGSRYPLGVFGDRSELERTRRIQAGSLGPKPRRSHGRIGDGGEGGKSAQHNQQYPAAASIY